MLFEGSARIASVGTVPFYGGGIKMFPFAGTKPGFFQLRVSNIGLLRGLTNVRGVWRGTYRPPDGAFDFLCRRIRIESDLPLPYQIAGDASGTRTEVEFSIDDMQVPLVNMNEQDTANPAISANPTILANPVISAAPRSKSLPT